jgi:GNAT superfamily N-acetyltransferase
MTISIEFVSKEKQHSHYDWADISLRDNRIGKARCKIDHSTIIIHSINIYPEWAGHGYGKEFVDFCKSHFHDVIVDRVRPNAIGFWEAEGFHNNSDGNWIYSKY